MVVSKMELYELLRKADGADIDFLREGVRTLAQALMEVTVPVQTLVLTGHDPDLAATYRVLAARTARRAAAAGLLQESAATELRELLQS